MSLIKIAAAPDSFSGMFTPKEISDAKKGGALGGGVVTGTAGAALGAGVGAFRQHRKNKKLDPSERQSVGKAALKGGAVGAGVGTVTGAVGGRALVSKGLSAGDKMYKDLPPHLREQVYNNHKNRTR